jgi:hypothetical protein
MQERPRRKVSLLYSNNIDKEKEIVTLTPFQFSYTCLLKGMGRGEEVKPLFLKRNIHQKTFKLVSFKYNFSLFAK